MRGLPKSRALLHNINIAVVYRELVGHTQVCLNILAMAFKIVLGHGKTFCDSMFDYKLLMVCLLV